MFESSFSEVRYQAIFILIEFAQRRKFFAKVLCLIIELSLRKIFIRETLI